jgi:hypothetical protein
MLIPGKLKGFKIVQGGAAPAKGEGIACIGTGCCYNAGITLIYRRKKKEV